MTDFGHSGGPYLGNPWTFPGTTGTFPDLPGLFRLTDTWAVTHNIRVTIRSCRDRRTADFLAGKRVRQFEACSQKATRALTKLQAATRLYDLRNPPSNRFEALAGSRSGEYSIRIDGQWRVCFRWATLEPLLQGEDIGTVHGEPYDVEINNHYS